MPSDRPQRVRVGELVAVGRTSDVYEFGSGAVVKVPRPDVPDHWAPLEAAYAQAVGALDLPAPSVIDVTQVDGRNAIVFERIDGRSMWAHMCDAPEQVESLAELLAATHRSIFEAGPPAGLDGMRDRTRRKLAEADRLSAAERSEAAQLLDDLPVGAALLHGDLHPGNVLMARDGPVPIDWFDASIGHPVSDILRSSLLLRGSGRVEPPHLPGADVPTLQRVHDTYLTAMSDFLSPVAELLPRWEAVKAVSRLSEGGHPDEDDLLQIWVDRDAASAEGARRWGRFR